MKMKRIVINIEDAETGVVEHQLVVHRVQPEYGEQVLSVTPQYAERDGGHWSSSVVKIASQELVGLQIGVVGKLHPVGEAGSLYTLESRA